MASLGKTLIETITSAEPGIRDRSVRELTRSASLAEKLQACDELETFRQGCQNLYERVRASLFLHAIYRYDIQEDPSIRAAGIIPFAGFIDVMERRYEQAITAFRQALADDGPNGTICSAWRRPTIRLPSRPWPTRSAGRSGAARGIAGCSGSAAWTSIPCGSIPASSSAIPTTPFTRSWSSARRYGWTFRTAPGRTSSSWAWIIPKARGC